MRWVGSRTWLGLAWAAILLRTSGSSWPTPGIVVRSDLAHSLLRGAVGTGGTGARAESVASGDQEAVGRRIIGGIRTDEGQFPWLVHVGKIGGQVRLLNAQGPILLCSRGPRVDSGEIGFAGLHLSLY